MPISHTHLRAFHAVADEGGFSRASTALRVSQPTLSTQVRALEDRYAVKLFDRRARGVELTDLGRALFDITRHLFSREAEAEQLLASARGLASGQLRVGADAPYHVVPILAAFTRRYPGIRPTIAFGNSEQVLEDLLHRHCDVGVIADLAPDPRLYALPFRRERLVAFVDRGHAWASRRSVRLAELTAERLVLRESGSRTRALFDQAAAEAGLGSRDVLEIGSREGVREAVAAGLGVGVVFESEFGRDDRLHRLALRDVTLEAQEYAACLRERRPIRVVRAFFDLLEEQTGSL